MISLATPPSNSPLSPNTGELKPAAGEESTQKGGFSAVLGGLTEVPPGSGEHATPAASEAEASPASVQEGELGNHPSGTAVPAAAKAGRILPASLPDIADAAAPVAGITPEQTAAALQETAAIAIEAAESEDIAPEASINGEKPVDAPAEADDAATGLPIAAMPQIELPVADEGDAPSRVLAGDAKPARSAEPALPTRPISQAIIATGEPGNPAQAPQTAASKAAPGTAVALEVTAEPHVPVQGQARRGVGTETDTIERPQPTVRADRAAEGLFAKTVSAEPQAQLRMDSAAPITQAAPSLPSPAVQSAARPPLQIEALQDLTRIIDRLAAAREAFAPATAALAIKHAEFGELSLRFDQQREGHLAVQLSAGDPETHRAIAAAVGDRPFAGTAENQAGGGHANAQSHSHARGAAAGRDGDAGNGNTARHEQPQQRSSASPNSEGDEAGPRRAGIFA